MRPLRGSQLVDKGLGPRHPPHLDGFRRQRDPIQIPAILIDAVQRCFTMAATTARRIGDLKDRLLGDGLVPLDTPWAATRTRHKLAFAEDNRRWIGFGTKHLDLLSRPEVFAQLRL